MANMKYCMFTNTLQNLQDCAEELSENSLEKLSKIERKNAIELIELYTMIANNFEDLLEKD